MSTVQRSSSVLISLVLILPGCTKSSTDVRHHGRSFSGGSYDGFWKSRTNDRSSRELAHLLIFYHGQKRFDGSIFVGPNLHITGQRSVAVDPNGFTLAPEGVFKNGKRIEGSAGERVFVVLLFEDCKVIPIPLSDSELEALSRDKIEQIESSTVWKKILDTANAE